MIKEGKCLSKNIWGGGEVPLYIQGILNKLLHFLFLPITSMRHTFGSWQHCVWLRYQHSDGLDLPIGVWGCVKQGTWLCHFWFVQYQRRTEICSTFFRSRGCVRCWNAHDLCARMGTVLFLRRVWKWIGVFKKGWTSRPLRFSSTYTSSEKLKEPELWFWKIKESL